MTDHHQVANAPAETLKTEQTGAKCDIGSTLKVVACTYGVVVAAQTYGDKCHFIKNATFNYQIDGMCRFHGNCHSAPRIQVRQYQSQPDKETARISVDGFSYYMWPVVLTATKLSCPPPPRTIEFALSNLFPLFLPCSYLDRPYRYAKSGNTIRASQLSLFMCVCVCVYSSCST